ncbi:hypothetical protein RSAG8_03488, partial [Rhizoctonia solani AG-8 WAC10335]
MHLMETPVASLNDKDGVMDLLQAFERRIAQQEKQSKEYFHQISGRLEKIEKRIELSNRVGRARVINSHGRRETDILYPVPLPNGDEVPAGQLPATIRGFFRLTDQALRDWIVEYELASPDDVPETAVEKRRVLADHFGIYVDR